MPSRKALLTGLPGWARGWPRQGTPSGGRLGAETPSSRAKPLPASPPRLARTASRRTSRCSSRLSCRAQTVVEDGQGGISLSAHPIKIDGAFVVFHSWRAKACYGPPQVSCCSLRENPNAIVFHKLLGMTHNKCLAGPRLRLLRAGGVQLRLPAELRRDVAGPGRTHGYLWGILIAGQGRRLWSWPYHCSRCVPPPRG